MLNEVLNSIIKWFESLSTFWQWMVGGVTTCLIAALIIFIIKLFMSIGKKPRDLGSGKQSLIRTHYLTDYKNFYGDELVRHRYNYVQEREEITEGKSVISNVLENIEGFLKGGKTVFILAGSGGLGKSRILIELAKKHPDIRFVYTRAYREMKEMEELKAGLEQVVKKGEVLVFDDCQDYSGYFPSFLDALRLKNTRLIAVSRYIEPVEDVIKARRLNYDKVKLGPMVNVSEIITDEKEIAEDILRISQGNPSIALMAIEHYKRRGTLRGIHDSLGLMQEILEDLVEAGENVGSPNPKLFLAELAVRSGLWETDELIKDNFEMAKKVKNMGHIIGEERGEKRIYYIVPDMLRDHIIRNVFFDSDEVSPKFKELASRVPLDDAVNIIRMLGIQFYETKGEVVYKRGCGEVLKRFQGVNSTPGIGFLAQPGKPSNEILIELGHEVYYWFGDYKFVTDFLGDFCHGAEKQNNPYYTHMAAEFYYKTGNLILQRHFDVK
jgi:hypothetical protein